MKYLVVFIDEASRDERIVTPGFVTQWSKPWVIFSIKYYGKGNWSSVSRGPCGRTWEIWQISQDACREGDPVAFISSPDTPDQRDGRTDHQTDHDSSSEPSPEVGPGKHYRSCAVMGTANELAGALHEHLGREMPHK